MSSCHLTYLVEIQFTVTAIETKKLRRKKVLLRVTRKVNLLVFGYGYIIYKTMKKWKKLRKKNKTEKSSLSRFEVY